MRKPISCCHHGIVSWMFLILLSSSSLVPVKVDSFELQPSQNRWKVRQLPTTLLSNSIVTTVVKTTRLWAKPPPVSIFDLDAIEAFELELDEQAAADEATLLMDLDDSDDTHNGGESVRQLEIPSSLKGKRIDAALTTLLEPEGLSRSFCGSLLANGQVSLVLPDQSTPQVLTRKSFKVEVGQILQVTLSSDNAPTEIVAQELPLDILFEDEHMIVLNKAAGMVVHPAAGNWDGTVVNALAHYLMHKSPFGAGDFHNTDAVEDATAAVVDEEFEGDLKAVQFRPGIVHRLDKGTTGVLVVAKTAAALTTLSESFAQRNVKKTYLAITVGNPGKRVVIDKPMERHPVHRQRMRVVPDPHRGNRQYPRQDLAPRTGRRALSMVDTIAFDGKLSLVQVRIETGRTHQIRVHLQDRHTPIYGDEVYGLSDWNKRLSKTHQIERPLLHAYQLELNHPVSGEHMVFQAPLADDMLCIAKTVYPQGQEELPGIFAARDH